VSGTGQPSARTIGLQGANCSFENQTLQGVFGIRGPGFCRSSAGSGDEAVRIMGELAYVSSGRVCPLDERLGKVLSSPIVHGTYQARRRGGALPPYMLRLNDTAILNGTAACSQPYRGDKITLMPLMKKRAENSLRFPVKYRQPSVSPLRKHGSGLYAACGGSARFIGH